MFSSSLSVPASRRISEDDISLFEVTNIKDDDAERHRCRFGQVVGSKRVVLTGILLPWL